MTTFVPQPGNDWPPGLDYSQSFGGVISAFNDLRVANFKEPKSYPHNFSGIILALKDLQDWSNAGTGEVPPGWEPTIDENGVIIGGAWSQTPKEGQLWYDTRDGRLKIWYGGTSGDFYQANGADGLTAVGATAPAEAPEGAQWFNTGNNALYIYYSGTWSLLSGTSASFDTLNLFVAGAVTTLLSNVTTSGALPNTSGITKQNDLNVWNINAVSALDSAITNLRPNTFIQNSNVAPNVANAIAGDLWYDTLNNDLKIFHKPNASPGTWEPVQATSAGQGQIDTLTTNLATTNTNLAAEIATTDTEIAALQAADTTNLNTLTTSVAALDARVDTLENEPDVDLSGYVQNTTYNPAISTLTSEIATVNSNIPDITSLATTAALNTEIAARQAALNNYTTLANLATEVTALTNLIPDITGKADITYVDTQIANVNNSINTITDSVTVTKTDIANVTLDFSGGVAYGNNAFKYKSNDSSANLDYYVNYGTNANLWEYAWEFNGNEDFCWRHTTGGVATKTFSINKDGAAATNLLIGAFSANDSGGRVMSTPIDVKDRLTKYQTALEAVRTEVTNATDFATLKAGLLTALASI